MSKLLKAYGDRDDTVRTKLALGDVVFVPPWAPVVVDSSGSSVVVSPPGPLAGGEGSPFGVAGGLHFNVGAGDFLFAIATYTFYGRFFGMAIQNRPNVTDERFWDVEIDMRTYPGRKPQSIINGDPQTGTAFHEHITAVPIATDLPDHVHTLRIGCGSNPTNNNRLTVHGFYLDARYYPEPQPSSVPSEPLAVPVALSATPDMSIEGVLLPHDPPTLSSPSVPAGAARRYKSLEAVEFLGGATDSDVDIYQNLANGSWVRRWRASKDPMCDGVPALGTALYHPVDRMAVGNAFKAITPFGSPSGVRVATWGATR